MRSCSFVLALWMLAVAPSCGSSGSDNPLPAGTVLDQFASNTPGSGLTTLGNDGFGLVVQRAQTFTVGVTGHLVAIEMIAGGNRMSELIVRIMPAPGGVIDEDPMNALETITIAEAFVQAPGVFSFVRLAGSGIPVTAGDELAITFEHPRSRGQVSSSTSGYAGGAHFVRDNQSNVTWTRSPANNDLFFGTYVAP